MGWRKNGREGAILESLVSLLPLPPEPHRKVQ